MVHLFKWLKFYEAELNASKHNYFMLHFLSIVSVVAAIAFRIQYYSTYLYAPSQT